MSKFKITRYELSDRLELFYARADGCSFDLHIDPSDLADLATAAQAALAEQNSKAMAERCQCGLKPWGDKYPICAAWKQSPVKSVKGCAECGHDDRCHHQAQRREA